MKTLRTTLFLFIWLSGELACTASSPFYRAHEETTNLRDCVVSTFESQVGIRELTGRNDGQDVERYLASVGFGKGYSWCGAFVHWTLSQCLSDEHLYTFLPNHKAFAWTPNFSAKRKAYGTDSPRPGDLFTLYYSSLKRTGHVGFIKSWTTGTKCITVEGNTNEAGSRSGDGVYVKYRLKSQLETVIDIIG